MLLLVIFCPDAEVADLLVKQLFVMCIGVLARWAIEPVRLFGVAFLVEERMVSMRRASLQL